MMLKKILILSILLMSSAFADEVTDKAEFKKLYAEFNELSASSADINSLIKVAEKLYKLNPKVNGKNNIETSEVTYNLANLYDKKGGDRNKKLNRKAFRLYEEYFELIELSQIPFDDIQADQYLNYIKSYYSIRGRRSKETLTNVFLEKLKISNLSELQEANYLYDLASIKLNTKRDENVINILESALDIYKSNPEDHISRINEVTYLIAINEIANGKQTNALTKLEDIVQTYEENNLPDDEFLKETYLILSRINFYNRNRPKTDKYIDKLTEIMIPNRIQFKQKSETDEDYLPIKRANPGYPKIAADRNLEGFIVVKFDVDKEGNTENVTTLFSSDEIFEKTAIKAAKKYKYKPKVVDGEPIKVKDVIVRIELRIAR